MPTFTPVDHDPFAPAKDSIPEGMTKAAGTGLAKGTMELAGSGGDMWSIIDTGLSKAGLDERTRGIVRSAISATPLGMAFKGPTSETIKGKVEEHIGEIRKPQTDWERRTENVASFVPGALMGPGNAVRNAAMFGVLPGYASEVAGDLPGVKGTKAEPYVKAATAVGTSLGAAGIVRPRSAAGAIRDAMPEGIDQATLRTAEQLFQEAHAAGVPITRAEAVQRVTGGASRLGDLQRVAEGAGEMKPFFAARPGQVETAGRRTFDEMGPRPADPSMIGPRVGAAADETVTGVRGAINDASTPFYDRSSTVRLRPDEMRRVRALPGYEEASAAVRNDPQLARYVQGLPEDSVGFLNEVKKYLDQASTNAASGLAGRQNMQRSAGYSLDATAVRDAGRRASPDYGTALDIQSTGRERYLEPLLQGPLGKLADRDIATKKAIEALFPTKPLANSAEEITTAVTAVAARNPVAARQLVQAHVESVFNAATKNLESGPNQWGGAKFATKLRGNPQQAENLEAAVRALPNGDQLWTGMDRFLTFVEAQGTRQHIGSQTTFNTQATKDLGRGTPIQEIGTAISTVGLQLPQKIKDTLERWRLGKGVSEIAHLLTNPEAGQRFRQIASMPAGSREASLIMGRLVVLAQKGSESTREADRARDKDGRQ